jgi:hypothetical protein
MADKDSRRQHQQEEFQFVLLLVTHEEHKALGWLRKREWKREARRKWKNEAFRKELEKWKDKIAEIFKRRTTLSKFQLAK